MNEPVVALDEHDRSATRRRLLGESTVLWSGHRGFAAAPGWWKAMSASTSVDYNVVLCHGADPDLVSLSLETVGVAKVPSVIMLAGPALGSSQRLIDAGWVCVGAVPFMVIDDIDAAGFALDANVAAATPEDLEHVWDVVAQTFHIDESLARVAIPDAAVRSPGQCVWILRVDGEIRSCVATVVVRGAAVVWSMATLPQWQHRGYGRRLLTGVLAHLANDGIATSLLYASPEGEPLYRALGYEVVEHWQMWSRPRWIFGRS